ncbi:MAG TPA: AAA family ATPase, partial [Asanoa sp.]
MDDGWVRVAPPSTPLLDAKLAPPPPPVNHIERPRVHGILDAGSRGPLTMLTAPAGSGKTVAMSSWTPPTDVASGATWFSIEDGDSGTRFWTYLQAGLCRTLSGGYGIDGVPPAGSVRTELYLEVLADALSRLPAPVIVVLDDLQETDEASLAGLDFLLAHAPRGIRIVAATRIEPIRFLHRWRLAGALTEVSLSDLAFTEAETGDLVRHRRAVGQAPYQVGDLWRRTDGWPAGLRLAADGRPGEPAYLGADGSPDQAVADYLVTEVLLAQPRHVQEVLLRASVPDRLCADLVDGLLDRTDGAQLIGELDRRALLLPTGTAPTAFRFHRMFREVLRAELARRWPNALAPLHRRAAAWLADNGLPSEALRHALTAGDDGSAVEVLLDHWSDLVTPQHDRGSSLQVPEPPLSALRTKPEVALAYAVDRLLRRDTAAADDYLRVAVDHDGGPSTGRQVHVALVARGLRLLRAQLDGDRAEVLAAASELLQRVRTPPPGVLDPSWVDRAASVALTAIGSARLDDGDLDAAERALCEALAAAERAGLACQRTTCTARLALIRAERGQLADAGRMALASWDMRACAGQAPNVHRAPAYLALALVALHRDRLAEADAHLDAAFAAGGSEPATAAMIAAVRVRVCRSRGDLDAGYAALLAGREALDGRPWPPGLARRLALAEADLRTAHGEPGDVRRWLEPAQEADPRSAALSVAAARACLDDGDPRTAAEVLPRWESGPDVTTPLTIRLEAGLVAARAASRLGDRRRAARALEAVLGMAEPEGHRRAFLDAGPDLRELLAEHLDSGTAYRAMVNGLVTAMEPTPPAVDPRQPAPSEPLTERELTVLRYLQSILSNGEIA